MMPARIRGTARERGFVLVLVLAILMILSMLASSVALVTRRLQDEQFERQRQVEDQLAMASTEATVLYLMLTHRTTLGGVTIDDTVVLSQDEREMQRRGDDDIISLMPVGNELALDGRAYRGLGETLFAVQDDRGLIGINWSRPDVLQRFIEQARDGEGANAARGAALPVETLKNLLADYQDPDDLYRLNSAEREQYEREGRPPPTNRTLVTPLELRQVKGWDEALAALSTEDLLGTVTVTRSPQININTAPARVLQALPGVDEAMAQRVLDARQLQPFINLGAFHQFLGAVPAADDLLSLYPSASGTIRLWPSRGGPVRAIHWTVTPWDDGGKPWREDYELILPQTGRQPADTARALATPLLAGPRAAPADGAVAPGGGGGQ